MRHQHNFKTNKADKLDLFFPILAIILLPILLWSMRVSAFAPDISVEGVALQGYFQLEPLVEAGEAYKDERASYAYEYSNYDKDFVLLLNAENGAWTHDSRHYSDYMLCWTWESWERGVLPNQEWCNSLPYEFRSPDGRAGVWWKRHYDYGFCGMSDGYKKHITDNPKFKTDWKWQVEQCHNEYTKGTRFYGWEHRFERGTNIIFNQL